MWVEIEFKVLKDIVSWKILIDFEKNIFKKVFVGLIGLDIY